jgi:hypothetical protein
MKTIKGAEVTTMKDESGQDLFYPNPAKEETKMGMWTELFGDGPAKIMRANYLSHCKNGYKDADGNKVRNIRDLEGNIIKTMELKDEDDKPSKSSNVVNTVALNDAVAVYKELVSLKNPALKKAIELQTAILKSLIPSSLMEADIDTLKFVIELKKAEAVEAVVEETVEKK